MFVIAVKNLKCSLFSFVEVLPEHTTSRSKGVETTVLEIHYSEWTRVGFCSNVIKSGTPISSVAYFYVFYTCLINS